MKVIQSLVDRHDDELRLVIGMYVDHLADIAAALNAPLITGKTAVRERERLYEAFRSGEERLLVVSKVANFSIDQPDPPAAIQVPRTFGSRQAEDQPPRRTLTQTAHGHPP